MHLRELLPLALTMIVTASAPAADLRLGIIGLDTSHVTAFTKLLNDPKHAQHVPGGKVVVAFKGGSADIESSASRADSQNDALCEVGFGTMRQPHKREGCGG